MDGRFLVCSLFCVLTHVLTTGKSLDPVDNAINVDKAIEGTKPDDVEEIMVATIVNETVEMFRSVAMPTDFESYDVLQVDGRITLDELINVTAAHNNAVAAFNDSDTDGDGFLSRDEFDGAPWRLQGDTKNALDADFLHQEILAETNELRKVDASTLISKITEIEQIEKNIALLENELRRERNSKADETSLNL